MEPIKQFGSLSHHEIVVLTGIAENCGAGDDLPSHWALEKHLEKMGYNRLALRIGLEKLFRKSMISTKSIRDEQGDWYDAYQIIDNGMNWILENEDQLNLKLLEKKSVSNEVLASKWDEDIPF